MPVAKKQQHSMKDNDDTRMREIYFDAQHPASFGGIKKLATALPTVDQKKIKSFLNQQWTYSLHKPIKRKFPWRKYVARGVNEQWQADLVEMQPYSRINQGYRYILCVIDVFSRYAYVRPIKSKSGPDVAEALEDIFRDTQNTPKYLQTDQGKEFYNQHVQSMLQRYNVELFSVYSDKKAAIVERFQRTLQERMYRAFTHQGNYRWMELLPQLIDSYNNSYHRSIKTTPASVSKKNETDVWMNQYSSSVKKSTKLPKFRVGDVVRIPKRKTIFSKGYIEKWTDEEFTIRDINTKYSPHLYTLADSTTGEAIRGSFYEQELQLVNNPTKLYRIEKILRTKTDPKTNIKHALVKWKGYTDPSWIDYNTVQSIINA